MNTKITFLIIDDDEGDRLNYKRLLKEKFLSFEVIEVDNAQSALEALEANPIYCILLDNILPGTLGLELLKTIKKSNNLFIPIIMLTGQGNEALAVEAMQAGASDYIVKKDISADVLHEKILKSLKKMEEKKQLELDASNDSLTGLMNRRIFEEDAERLISSAKRYSELLAILFIDVDNFKQVNDSLGHLIGDEVLSEIAHTIKQTLRKEDICARFGGDEFVVMLRIQDYNYVEQIVKKIMENSSLPLQISHGSITCSLSIGIALYPKSGSNLKELLKNADIALFKAKDLGRKNYQYYEE
jgi:diguanylate cyclase (GGDEF)-like protein